MASARTSALRVLARVRRDAAFGGAALSAELRAHPLSSADAALATRLVYGVLGAEGVLDDAINQHLERSVEPRIRDVLRLAAYESLFGHAPAYAVVDEAVDAARRIRPQAAGLVNAVARRVAERAEAFPWGDPAADRDALARASACPRWVVDEYLDAFGEDRGRDALLACSEVAPTYVRLDPFAASPDETLRSLEAAAPRACAVDPLCFELGHPAYAFSAEQHAGWFPMDAAAQMAPRACAPSAGERVLDAGAGRGNKTSALQSIAVRSGGPASITALELHGGKAERLRERLSVSGVPGVSVVTGDALHAVDVLGPEPFDHVLLDAPCTGLGTLRRYPEKRWKLAPSDITRMAALQEALLDALAGLVRPRGRLVYSTCSVSSRENGGVLERFLSGGPGQDFVLESIASLVPSEWGTFLCEDGTFLSCPVVGGPDGHYVAVLRRGTS